MAVIARICEGVSYSIIQSTTYGVGSQELPSYEFDKFARLSSCSAGLGGGLALILGSLFFTIGGYMLPYFVLGSAFLLLAAVVYLSGAFTEDETETEGKIWVDEGFNEQLINTSDSSDLKESRSITHSFALSFPVSRNCLPV